MTERFDDGRLCAPAAERNKGPILEVLQRVLPQARIVVEIASGTGQHVAHFAAALPELVWQPSDADLRVHESIRAWTEGLTNVRPPIALDVQHPWPLARADAVLCINMIHISPWAATLALIDGAGRVLPQGGVRTVRIDASAAIPRRATRRSTPRFAPRIPTGACAISRRWKNLPRPRASG